MWNKVFPQVGVEVRRVEDIFSRALTGATDIPDESAMARRE
jgi:hypothetical protein